MRYKAMLIDADNTLFDFTESERRAIGEILAKYGYDDPSAPQVYHECNDRQWKLLEKKLTTHDKLRIDRFVEFIAHFGRKDNPEAMCDDYMAALARQHILIPGAMELLAEVAAHIPVAIVTNGIARIQHGRFDSSPLMKYVKALVISQEEGYDKPDPRLLHVALERLGGIAPEDALMVGDSLTSDILGAHNAGMDACWYNPGGKPLPENMDIKYMITDIRDAAAIALQR